MTKHILPLLLLPLLACEGNAQNAEPEEPAQEWKLVWGDEFDGTQLDTLIWSKIPRGTSDWNRHMSPDSSLFEVSNGTLKLRGILNPDRLTDPSLYLTGGVYTKDKRTLTWGRVEVRAKLPQAKGCWPAIWMMPETGRWPDAGEIDIMEHLNFDRFVYQTVHSYYTYVLGIKDNPPSHGTASIDPDGFNTYAVEKRDDKLIFYVNGNKTFEYPRISTDKEGQYPFTTPYYLLVDMQLGGSWVGDVDATQLPVEMEVDWVRVYEEP
jgi:beta-glucanase (GH16 family)